ncbi:MAG TPA: helix-hairpin-helix domain-containing protein [Burkholderiaceae bacterium]|nr:helix-hairpin-helix domain-containing protein [Burkholderiaceae bacterium]
MRRAIACVALAVMALGACAAGVDANTASQAELEQITGIGPSVAVRILDARRKRPFDDWRDMIGRVGGIGERSAAKFSAAGLTVNGASYRAGAAGPTQ